MGRQVLKLKSPMMRGQDVKDYQTLVKRRGFDAGTIDGIYGDQCVSACKAFQKQNGLGVDGICGAKTWAALEGRRVLKLTSPMMRGDDVQAFQALVKGKGHNPGAADGVYGSQCVAACKAFQKASGLSVDGVCGKNTWAALEQAGTEPKSAHFKMSEFRCKDGTNVPQKYWGNLQKLMNALEELRAALGNKPIVINSGYRTETYNKKCGGATKSQHLYGAAADIHINGVSPETVYKKADQLFSQGGVGRYASFTHVDVRGYKSRWNG